MNFWKNHASLRAVLIAIFFVLGLTLTIVGWKMTGQLNGLILMLVGMVFLLTALFVYNAPHRK
jgi:ATP/ADP translocase